MVTFSTAARHIYTLVISERAGAQIPDALKWLADDAGHTCAAMKSPLPSIGRLTLIRVQRNF
jgi:hypothetical protein